jgi:hypothetical protein
LTLKLREFRGLLFYIACVRSLFRVPSALLSYSGHANSPFFVSYFNLLNVLERNPPEHGRNKADSPIKGEVKAILVVSYSCSWFRKRFFLL